MTNKLFHDKAVEHATRRIDGKVILVPPMLTWVIGGVLIALLTVGVIFAAAADYTRKETVSGWLVPEAGAVRLTARRGGIVEEILVESGEFVREGELIATIKLSIETESGDLGENLGTTIRQQISAAEERFSAADRQLIAQTERLERQLANVRVEQSALREQLEIVGRRVETTRENADWAKQNYEEGLTTKIDSENWNAALMELEQDKAALELAYVQSQSRIEDVQQQLSIVEPERSTALANLNATRAELQERLARSNSEASYKVISPLPGHIDTIAVELGETVGAGSTMGVLSPEGSDLIAELYVPSRAIGFVRSGQSVQLKYDAFPFQRFGTGNGTVQEVSRTVLAPREINIAGVQLVEPVFRVNVAIESTSFGAYGEQVVLRSGMRLSAEILIDRRSLLELLLDPLYAAGMR